MNYFLSKQNNSVYNVFTRVKYGDKYHEIYVGDFRLCAKWVFFNVAGWNLGENCFRQLLEICAQLNGEITNGSSI